MSAALLRHIDAIELVSPNRLATMAAPTFSGTDQVVGIATTLALGYSRARLGGVESRSRSTFGMPGSNGSVAYADIAVAVMRNRIVGDMSASNGRAPEAAGLGLLQKSPVVAKPSP